METKKVLLITNIPTPYRIPLFNELSKQLEVSGMELIVVFGAMGYARRKWKIDMTEIKFKYEILQSRKFFSFDSEKMIFSYSGLYKIINNERPSLIITNAFSISTLKLWWQSFFKHTQYVIWSGAIARADNPENWLRKIQRRALVKRAAGFISYGTLAKRYLISLGALEDKVTIAFNTVDTEFFSKETTHIRANLQSDGKKHLLYIGEISPRKNVIKLLKAAEALKNIRRDFVLDLVGDGSEREILQSYAKEKGLEDVIRFHGFKQKKDLPFFYGQAACFLFQTDFDIWGLVLVEAMASGIPCISSIHAGATVDLIQDGKTGFIIDFNNKESFFEKIIWIFDNPDLADKIGLNAKNFIENTLSLGKTAESFIKRINFAIC